MADGDGDPSAKLVRDEEFHDAMDHSEEEFMEADSVMAGNLRNVLANRDLKWIFVGGKGGVGKTTCSSAIAVLIANSRQFSRVLILSTDPAHNVSDAFRQKFSTNPTKVKGFSNLWAMELDATATWNDSYDENEEIFGEEKGFMGTMKKYFQGIMGSIPGIDEAMSYFEVIKLVQGMNFDVVIFDTAPTGHTLRLLSMPTVIETALDKVSELKNKFFPFIPSGITSMIGLDAGNSENMQEKMSEIIPVVRDLKEQFRNANLTTFVCVCIAEFLSVYETERLIQKLGKFGMDSHNIIINQLVFPLEGELNCKRCYSRRKLQSKYCTQLEELFDNFHIIKLPLLEDEVHGKKKIEEFSKMLLEPPTPGTVL